MRDAAWIEQVFRQANEIIAEHVEALGRPVRDGGFVCECADETCTEQIELSVAEFRQIQSHSNRFVIAPGHELPDVERLIEEHQRFAVVERTTIEEKREADFPLRD